MSKEISENFLKSKKLKPFRLGNVVHSNPGCSSPVIAEVIEAETKKQFLAKVEKYLKKQT